MKSDKENALSVRLTAKSSYPQQQPITLFMIVSELESDLIKLRSRFVRAIIKVFGINQK